MAAALAGLPATAHAAVTVVVVDHLDLERAAASGAVGLVVPGWGDTVSRERALDALRSGHVTHSSRPERGEPVIDVASTLPPQAEGDVVVTLELPPPGEHPNDARYPIAITGGGFSGILTSPSTRIRGLVSIGDVAPTVLDLEGRAAPDTVTGRVLSSRPDADVLTDLRDLDGRLAATRDSRLEASVGYAALVGALVAAAFLARTPLVARAALLSLPAAALASLALSMAGIAAWWAFLLATVGLTLAGAAIARGRFAVAVLLTGVLVFHYAVLLADSEAMSLSLLGPNPDAGGRFYGLANELETILAGTAIVAAALAWERLGIGALIGIGGLALVTIAPGPLGASVTGAVVVVVGLAVLALDLEGRRGLVAVAVAALAAAAALLLAAPDQLSGDPGRLADRIELSARIAIDSPQAIFLVFAAGLLPLLLIAWRYRTLRAGAEPADAAALLALLVATPVSLVLNDSPDKVLAHAAAWCLALTAWTVAGSGIRRPKASYRLAPVCVAPSARPRWWF
jgi:hypothetical protein